MSSSLRIANTLFDDRFGGPQKRVIEVAARLKQRGVITLIYLPAGSGNAEAIARKAGMDVIRLDISRIPRLSSVTRVLKWAISLPGDILRFRSAFIESGIDVVHVNGAFFLAPALGAKLARVPLVWHLNDTIVSGVLRVVFGSIVSLLADQIAVAAEAVALHYRVAARPHRVLYAPVDADRFAVARSRAIRPKPELRRVVLIANWNPIKGIEYFVEAAALVRQEVREVEFVLVGARVAGHDRYAQLIDDRIEELRLADVFVRPGFVTDVPEVIAGADVLVLSSVSEACPICVLEAMAAGVPVVATEVGGVRELLEAVPGEPAGEIVPPRDSGALATAITRMLSDEPRAIGFGESGRRIAKQLFDIEVCVDAHEEIYRELCKR
jgi:glycosyltransferase involved in cell wall biosynthesis